MWILYSRDAVADPRRYEDILAAGGDVRVADELPMKLCICDGSEAMLSLRDPVTHQQGLTSMIIRHPDLVAALELVFEAQWERSEPLGDERVA